MFHTMREQKGLKLGLKTASLTSPLFFEKNTYQVPHLHIQPQSIKFF